MIIKQLNGYSTSKVFLIKENGVLFVRKFDNIKRNLEKFESLKELNLPMPKILSVSDDYYDIEYIKSLDISNYLLQHNPIDFLEFITNTIDCLYKGEHTSKNYAETFYEKTKYIFKYKDQLNFTQDDLLKKLDNNLFSSTYFGDLSFDNILYDIQNKRFVLIDGVTTEYDSVIFDLAKLTQDIKCKWFIRNEKVYINQHLNFLNRELSKRYEHYNNPYHSILMMLRVLPYHRNEKDKNFILKRVNELWL